MFPVSDVIPPRRIPTVTIGLIVVNLGFFLYELQLGSTTTALPSLVRARGVIPVDFAWLSAFTSLFLHAGWVHAGSNALYLWLFGGSVEDAFGRAGFAATYLACGAAGALVHAATHPWSAVPLIGASAAVGGVMGAYFVLYPASRILMAAFALPRLELALVEAPAVFFLGIWFVVQLFADAGSIVAAAVGAGGMWAHLAGLVTGAICGAWSRFGRRSLGRWWR
jgi:membrane associated rhomboid family serine protease